MNIKVIIATNKLYRFPVDSMYLPVQVGCAFNEGIEGFQPDDVGDNISDKNKSYCELTGLYWGWKNLECDFMGLAHYRRHFGYKRTGDKWGRILTSEKAEKILSKYPAIVTSKRKYYIETLYSHYCHTHNEADLKATREIIEEKYPKYLECYDKILKKTWAHMFNMYIMRKDLSDAYCKWLFDILEEVEKLVDVSNYSDHDKRLYGRISELLLDVWLTQNEIKYKEVPLVFMENAHWPKKILGFLRAKFVGK